jgi:hypothetical protein
VPGWPKVAACFGSDVAAGLRIALKTGLNISPLELYAERYIYDLSANVYVDLEARANDWSAYVFTAKELTERHLHEILMIDGKPREAFKVFQRSKSRIEVATRELFPEQEPNHIIRVSLTGKVVDSDYTNNSRLCFNTFPGFVIKPTVKINAELMAECKYRLNKLLGFLTRDNENQITWIKNWLAYTLKYPGDKQQIALVMLGGQGTGKTFFGQIFLNALFGSLHSLANSKVLSGDFGVEPVIDKFMVYVDEAFFFEKGSIDFVKQLVRSDRINGQRKHENARTFNNYSRFIFANNNLKCGLVEEDTFDRAMFMVRPYDAASKNLNPRDEWRAWQVEQKPFFDEFGELLKRDDAREHFMRMFMDLNPVKGEVESTAFSSGFDVDMIRGNMGPISRIIVDLIQDCCIAGYDAHIDGVFTKTAFMTRVGELIKNLGYKASAGRVFDTMEECKLIEPLRNGNWRTTQKIGSLAETYSEIVGVKVTPKLTLTEADFGPNLNELKLPPKSRVIDP